MPPEKSDLSLLSDLTGSSSAVAMVFTLIDTSTSIRICCWFEPTAFLTPTSLALSSALAVVKFT